MTKTIDQIRNAFKTPEREAGNLPNNYYPFWNMKDGEQATVRFLPDADNTNPMGFLVEKVMHNLSINGERKSVPCLSMYSEQCPICALSQKYYKANDRDNGKKYWKKKQYITQALIMEDPLVDDSGEAGVSVGTVKYVTLGFQLFNIIKAAFEDGELDEVPYAYTGGTDFIIKKTKQGDYSTYTIGSKFARRSTDLDEDTVANLQLIDLSTLLPKNPGLEKVEAMLEAAVSGVAYDDSDDHGSHDSGSDDDSSVQTTTTVSSAVKEEVATTSHDEDINMETDDILAAIRNRRQNG